MPRGSQLRLPRAVVSQSSVRGYPKLTVGRSSTQQVVIVSRAKKIMLVGLVLALGAGLAWPFRKSASDYLPEDESFTKENQQEVAPAVSVDARTVNPKHTVAQMTSTADHSPKTPDPSEFDLESHPVIVQQESRHPRREVVSHPPPPSDAARAGRREARPVYDTSPPDRTSEAAWPEEIVHIVRNGDTLEKLAERYLGDAGRALELFDLNREQLTNPHLLPIGAELRIPVPPRRDVD